MAKQKQEGTERIGQIVGAFGIRGQVKIEPLTAFFERFQKGTKLRLKDQWVTVESYALHKDRPLIKLSGIDTMTAAEKLQWEFIEGASDFQPELDDDEFLTEDLIGMKVLSETGEELGIVDDVLVLPAHDVLVVGEIMIPAIKEFVLDVDLDDEVMTVKLIPGMRPGED